MFLSNVGQTKVTFSEFGRNYESIIIALASERGNQRVSGTYITLNTQEKYKLTWFKKQSILKGGIMQKELKYDFNFSKLEPQG